MKPAFLRDLDEDDALDTEGLCFNLGDHWQRLLPPETAQGSPLAVENLVAARWHEAHWHGVLHSACALGKAELPGPRLKVHHAVLPCLANPLLDQKVHSMIRESWSGCKIDAVCPRTYDCEAGF